MRQENYTKSAIRIYLTNFWSHLAQGDIPEMGAQEDNWPPRAGAVTNTKVGPEIATDIKIDMERAIKSLPERQRLAVILHFIENLPLKDVSLFLRNPKATNEPDSGLPSGDLAILLNQGINSMHKFLNRKQWGGTRTGTGPKSSRREKRT